MREAIQAERRDTLRRIARLESVELDGTRWWYMAEVRDALRAPANAMARLIDAADKRTKVDQVARMLYKRSTLINRRAIERLAIRYGGVASRAEILEALDGKTVE